MPELLTSDGLTLAWYEWRPDAPAAERGLPPVVLHHGFAVDARTNFVRPGVVDALVAAGRWVVALDARGHGASAKPHDPARYGEARMAVDVSSLIDLLGVPRIHLVGYSMGAIVALLTAAADPRVDRLVVGGVGEGVVAVGGLDTRAVGSDAIADALTVDDPAAIADPGARGFRALADAIGADRTALAAQARAAHAGPVPFDRITVPTLVLAGEADPLAVRPEVLAGALPDARLEVLAGDHLQAVVDPRFAAAVIEFLDTAPD